jgi:hypothetical protein
LLVAHPARRAQKVPIARTHDVSKIDGCEAIEESEVAQYACRAIEVPRLAPVVVGPMPRLETAPMKAIAP